MATLNIDQTLFTRYRLASSLVYGCHYFQFLHLAALSTTITGIDNRCQGVHDLQRTQHAAVGARYSAGNQSQIEDCWRRETRTCRL